MNAPFLLDNRLTVVLFAGMGGGCDGLEDAGYHVHVAINHDPVAVAVHERRHPHTRHLRCDVFEADPRAVCQGRGVRVLHASPDCTHFSVAKGSKPVSKRRRSLAWVVCRWAGTVRPETITLENVQEITTWSPLIAKRDPATGRVLRLDGSVAAKGERVPVQEQWLIPDPRKKGRIWRAFLRHLGRLNYNFEHRVLICADFGVPTIRKRLFGVATADGRPVVWPERTHAPRKDAKRLGLKPWVGAHTIIDWSLPVRSIFDRPKALVDASHRRIAHGIVKRVLDDAAPFIVPITHSGAAARVHPVDEPLRTLTTAHRGELAVVVPTLIQSGYGERAGQAPRVLDLGEPAGTQVGGNCLLPAVTGKSHAHLILPFLQHYYGSGKQDDDVRQPLGALTSKARYGLVEVQVRGETYVIDDIGTRMLEPEEGAAAHGFRPGALPDEITIDGKTRRLTKTEKYHLVGNSVPSRMIQLLAELNVRRELAEAAE